MSDNCSSVASAAEAMYRDFTERIKEIEVLALLHMSSTATTDLKTFAMQLSQAEMLLDELTRVVDRDMNAINNVTAVTKRLQEVRTRSSRLERHMLTLGSAASKGSPGGKGSSRLPSTLPSPSIEDDDTTVTIISKANSERGPIQLAIPTQKQFESVPKYMRSLTGYDTFTNVCDLINLAAERKRAVMEVSQDRLGPTAKAFLVAWKAQQTSDVSNLTFVTDEDVLCEVENANKLCSANDIKAGLQVLRNLDFIRVSPHENQNRYIFLK